MEDWGVSEEISTAPEDRKLRISKYKNAKEGGGLFNKKAKEDSRDTTCLFFQLDYYY